MKVSIVVFRAIVDEMARRSFDTDSLCRSVGFDPALLLDAAARVPIALCNRLTERCLELTNEPQLGLYVGTRAPGSGLTVLSPIVLASSSLRAAAEMVAAFGGFFMDGFRWEIDDQDGNRVAFRCVHPDGIEFPVFAAEMSMALISNVVTPLVQTSSAPVEVRLPHAATGGMRAYRMAFPKGYMRFEAGEAAFVCDKELFDARLAHPDAELQHVLRKRADALLEDIQSGDDLPARIRNFVEGHRSPSTVSVEMVAQALRLSERSLRRRLARLHAGPRAVIDGALRDMACRELRDRSVSIKEVAFRLGYAEPRTFQRAFRRWTGTTPATFQARQTAA